MLEIVMAAYNGEKYLQEQLDSILAQTEQGFTLRIADDASADGTAAILQDYARRFPDKITLLLRKKGTGSARNNFFDLLATSKAEYVMTCDQDDCWNPDKVRLSLDTMHRLEAQYGKECPLLVHTDLSVADGQLQVINPSMYQMQHTDPCRNDLRYLLTQNTVTGCTMLVNRALLDKLQAVPPEAILHDWWCALVASALGHIGFVPTATMRYRQHECNQVGAKNARSLGYMLHRLFDNRQAKEEQVNACRQAAAFAKYYQASLTDDQLALLTAYASLPQRGFFARRGALIRYGFWEKGAARKVKQLLKR